MNSFDNIWEEIHSQREWGKYPSEDVIRFIARNYYDKNRNLIRILDLGCGQGANTWYIAREGFNTYAVDGSNSAVNKACRYLEQNDLSAQFIVCDVVHLPYEDNFFDTVVDGAVLYSNKSDNIKRILRESLRILKVGGKGFWTGLFKVGMSGYKTGIQLEPNTFKELTEGPLSGKGIVHFFYKEEIMKLWKEAGFNNIKIDFLERTDYGGKDITSYYIVEAKK